MSTQTFARIDYKTKQVNDQRAIGGLNHVDSIYVISYVYLEKKIFARGMSAEKRMAKMQINVPCGVFLLAHNRYTLAMISDSIQSKWIDYDKEFILYPKEIKTSRHCAIAQLLGECNPNHNLVFVPLLSFEGAPLISRMFVAGDLQGIKKYTIEIHILIYKWLIGHDPSEPIFNVWIDKDLKLLCEKNENELFHILAFDLETVTAYEGRVPLGNYESDSLVSASFVERNPQQQGLVVRAHILIPFKELIEKSATMSESHCRQYKYYKPTEIEFLYYTEERELVRAVMNEFINLKQTTIVLGYNSRSYDFTFLFNRALYLEMEEVKYFKLINNNIVLGNEMIAIDLYCIFHKFYKLEFESLTLGNVSKRMLGEGKVNVPATIYHYIYKKILVDEDICFEYLYKSKIYYWKDLILYNIIDSVLVVHLWEHLGYDYWVQNLSKIHHFSIDYLYQTSPSEYLQQLTIFDLLINGTAIVNDDVEFTLSHRNGVLEYNDSVQFSQDKTYSGGFNYCLEQGFHKQVYAMDMKSYYPSIIFGFNISKETVSIVQVKHFLPMIPFISRGLARYFVYTDHTDLASGGNSVVVESQFILGFLENVPELEEEIVLNVDSLKTRLDESQFIVIILKPEYYTGFLPAFVKKITQLRFQCKADTAMLRKTIKRVLECVASGDKEANFVVKKYPNLLDSLARASHQMHDDAEVETWNEESKQRYLTLLKGEATRTGLMERALKICVNSIYGLTGAPFSHLASRSVSAIVTLLGRKYIIESAKIANDYHYLCLYTDTDSLFVVSTIGDVNPHSPKAIADKVLSINPALDLNFEKFTNVVFFSKKVYITETEGGGIKSVGIVKNGPPLWKEVLYETYQRFLVRREDISMVIMREYLCEVYCKVYESAKDDPESIVVSRVCKSLCEYKQQNTPAKTFIERQLEKNPFFQSTKIKFYYKFINCPNNVYFGDYDELSREGIESINAYKFYNKIENALYNILKIACQLKFESSGHYYILDKATFTSLSLDAFALARSKYTNKQAVKRKNSILFYLQKKIKN